MILRRSPRQTCHSAGKVTAALLLTFIAASSTVVSGASWHEDWFNPPNQVPLNLLQPSEPLESKAPSNYPNQEHDFTLRHIFHHGTHLYPDLHARLDIHIGDKVWTEIEGEGRRTPHGSLYAKSRQITIQRLSDRRAEVVKSLIDTAQLSGVTSTPPLSAWALDEIMGPNVTDRETLLSLARMAGNAYTMEPGTGEWQDVNGGFNHSQSLGWEGDGLRGHVFADKDNSTIVVALKGTSPAVFDGAETTSNDKENDNLFASCCCGQGGHYLWRQVCDCQSSAFTCNTTCLVKALKMKNRYYQASLELYGNITALYPNSNIWLSGHSLGGAVSSLLGLTYGLPVTTFEAYGEALAAARLGIPSPPGSHPSAPQTRRNTAIYHFGHTADPIFMGTCNAATSGCTLGGYALESQCHLGQVCVYDTVRDKSWRVGIGNHKIWYVIKDVIEAYDDVAPCMPDSECVDCYNWKYFESNGTDPTTSTKSSSSSTTSMQTRTTTCKTPGWWGCLDESTTTGSTSSTSTSITTTSSSTETCHSYGWFGGCLDPTTTTKTSTSATQSNTGTGTSTSANVRPTSFGSAFTTTTSSSTETCHSYGWLGGCLDPTMTSQTSTSATQATCEHHWWFWGRCRNQASMAKTHSITSPPTAAPSV